MNCQDDFLCDILHDNLKQIILGHLSKENNYAKLAYETVKLEVTLGDNAYKGDDLICLWQKETVFQKLSQFRKR